VGRLNATLRAARGIVFDFYGTLAGDRVSVPPMWEELSALGYPSHPALEAMYEPDAFDGWPTPRLEMHAEHGAWLRGNWREFVRLSGVPSAQVEGVLDHLLKVRDRYEASALPGAVPMLAALRERGVAIGLCSNWESPIEPYLRQAGLGGFDAVVTSAILGVRKPHPAIFAEVCARLGLEPSVVVFVGDNWSADITGALRAGSSPVWVRNGRPSVGLELVPEVDTIADLACAIDETLPGPTGDRSATGPGRYG
jgi:putative hydrolase of the HAD superfamily